jgi:diguanylate cyclase (GGDEF)-like protein
MNTETPDFPVGSSPEGGVLLVGLEPAERVAFLEGLRSSGLGARLIELGMLSEALVLLDSPARVLPEVLAIVVGSGGAVAGWEDAGVALRRAAPNAALVAVTGAQPGPSFHDVVTPGERAPALLGRVLRCGLLVAETQYRMARWAMRDPLTDVLNRRGLDRVLVRESSDGERGHGALSALLVDCDDFKRINDRFGLSVGDDVLRRVANALTRCVRARDTVGRVGGDEFLVLLPHTRVWEAVEVADRIRREVRTSLGLPDGDCLTVSIGVRRLEGRSSVRAVVEATQEGLHQSKRDGKDQVRVVDPAGGSAPARGDGQGDGEGGELPGPVGPPVRRVAAELSTGAPVLYLVELPPPTAPIQLATLRATHPEVDRQWFRAGLAAVMGPLPTHVRIYPDTVVHTPLEGLLGDLPPGIKPAQVTLALDDQYLSGDPGVLALHLVPLREAGFQLALETADLGRSCLEALILLRPDRVMLDAALVRGVAGSRVKPNELSRMVRVCESLKISVFAGEVASEPDCQALLDLGIRVGIRAGANG